MLYISHYDSQIGRLLLTTDDNYLTGLWFSEGKYQYYTLDKEKYIEKENNIIKETKKWLKLYFQGKKPDFCPPLNPTGSKFQEEVWEILKQIPYGKTITYHEIAKKIAELRKIKVMSAQAIGGAVGHNKISIIIPCHRVIGTNGKLTGYAGGLDKKYKLLALEGHNMKQIKK